MFNQRKKTQSCKYTAQIKKDTVDQKSDQKEGKNYKTGTSTEVKY